MPSSPLLPIHPTRLCNPYTGEPLERIGDQLLSQASGQRFPIRHGIPSFVHGAKLPPRSRSMRWFYDRIAFAYDFTLRLGPRLRYGTEALVREQVVAALPIRDGDALLETAAGTCLNLPFLPLKMDYSAVDISWNMLIRARRNLAGWGRTARLFHADAQFLPFPDHSFNHVLQMGALQFIQDPFLALREMARVAKPGALVTVLDEGSKVGRMFRRLPAHAAYAHAGLAALPRLAPPGARVLRAELLPSGEFYILQFQMPG